MARLGLSAAAAVALVVGGCDPASNSNAAAADGSCTYEGHTYEDGESFRSGPNCPLDDCSCHDGGIVCLFMPGCGDPLTGNTPDSDFGTPCAYGGRVYQDGEEFLLGDGCSTCRCEHGNAWCLLADCGTGGAAGASGGAGRAAGASGEAGRAAGAAGSAGAAG